MSQSSHLFDLAQRYIPGGVNSPVRAFNGVGGVPVFIQRGAGAYLVDADGQEYIDYIGSWGPMIVGHAHPTVIQKVTAALQNGFSFGAPTEIEVKLAAKVCELMPSIEMVRFVNSGTETAMSAIRLARGFTKRDKFIKFVGCYHGHADCLLVAAGSGSLTLGVPNSAGVPAKAVEDTLLAEFNNLNDVQQLFEKYGDEIAAVIVEPVAGNMNFVVPQSGFLQGLREFCDRYGSVLIFDEVMTGFRVGLGGAQALWRETRPLRFLASDRRRFSSGRIGGRADIMRALRQSPVIKQAPYRQSHCDDRGLATLN